MYVNMGLATLLFGCTEIDIKTKVGWRNSVLNSSIGFSHVLVDCSHVASGGGAFLFLTREDLFFRDLNSALNFPKILAT